MRKKLLVSIICIAALLAGCGNADTSEISDTAAAEVTEDVTTVEALTASDESETDETEQTEHETESQTEAESETSAETGQKERIVPSEIKTLTRVELGVNEDGSLSEAFMQRIEELMKLDHKEPGVIYPSLYDFNDDGIPEIFLVIHNDGQGYMPCKVYSADDLSYLGEFKGFCRDGFTHFEQAYGGTVIHSYYEHSVHQRQEDVIYAEMVDGKLETTWLASRSGTIRGGESWATIGVTETINEEAPIKYSPHSLTENGSLMSYFDGYAFTSYGTGTEYNERASAAVESYNNYIKYSQLAPYDKDDPFYSLTLLGDKNQMAFWQNKDGLFFISESGEKTLLPTSGYWHIYKLWDSIVVCQPSGNSIPCDIYMVNNGKPELIEEISGHGMFFDYSGLYNGGFEMIHSTYDLLSEVMGGHSLKKYQFHFTIDGIREYGSIVVPTEEFYSVYGDAVADIEKQIAEDDYEIYEVLYRSDHCFILNCRQAIYLDEVDEEKQQFAGTYRQAYAVVKPMIDGTLSEIIEWDGGKYLTALCPDIAVYPEKMYLPGEY